MTKNIDALYETFRLVLDLSQPVARLEQFGLDPADIDELRFRHTHQKEVDAQLARMQVHAFSPHTTWYAGPHATDTYWPALVTQLNPGTTHSSAFADLDAGSSRVVAHLSHPKEPSFSTRGMVLTYPQSGTTTNIAAVIAKAADRGYRLFIVLSGLHNALRQQIQQRLKQQLIQPHPSRWLELTTTEQDFQPLPGNPASILNAHSAPVLCVVKKNATVLRRLVDWLTCTSDLLHEFPALVIDTEANQPSVTSTSITPRVRGILRTLPRVAYVGYVSTPLNGLLLEPGAADLFPKDFIVALPRPGHYTGPEVLFGRYAREEDDSELADDGYDMIRSIPESEVPQLRPMSRAEVQDFAPQLPASLYQAVEYFWMVAAARTVRGSGSPQNTMLIHTSVNTTVHSSFLAPLRALRTRTAQLLSTPSYLAHLRQIWQQETQRVAAEDFGEETVSFDQLLAHLPTVLQDCRIITDTSSNDHLGESGPLTAIVVGGTPLTRGGLALEGMSVGYYVTAVSAYDTLQQMERWFGIRTGYADLPRIWMTEELAAWWSEIVDAETELRLQLERAIGDDITPLSLATRVRSHPKLRIIKAAKQGQPLPSISYGGRRVQTRYFHTNADWLNANLEAARTLITASTFQAAHIQACPDLGRYVFFNLPSDLIIDFLATYHFHEKSPETDPGLLIDYIRKRNARAHSLRQWNVAILGKPAGTGDDTLTFADHITVGRIIRSQLNVASPQADFADIKTLMGPRDAAVDLAGDTGYPHQQAIAEARRAQLPDTGLLALYPIDKTSAPGPGRAQRAPLNAEEHVIGVGIIFPEPLTTDSIV
ncbi:Z1 domain-containing protein [Streptomyces sp. NPDC086766]|uniref:Z1 domain-containing protein n=1 Tax=Streptomyces sp. NPDC086766 TaxID=3365754 RepID=UPI0037F73EE5